MQSLLTKSLFLQRVLT